MIVDSIDKTVQIETRSGDRELAAITILGQIRDNPYSLTNINAANTSLYGQQATPKQKTHTYVRFEPQTYDDLALLEDWETKYQIPFFDTPFEYEILQQGEYYYDPAVSDSILTYQYSSVPVGVPLPNVQHTELEELYLDDSDLFLLIQSFYDSGNGEYINNDLLNGGLTEDFVAANTGNDIIPDITAPPPYPCENPNHDWVLVFNVTDGSINSWYWQCQPPPPYVPYDNPNTCGCQIPTSSLRPAGCIEVDEQGTNVGVEIAQVNIRKGYNTEIVYTNDQGCCEAANTYNGKVRMHVKFKNDNVKVRDTRYWIGTTVVKDQTSGWNDPPYNNHYLLYGDDVNDVTSTARRYWASAHSLNFVNRYRSDAAADNIQLPRKDLNWLNNAGDRDTGGAPMLQGNLYSLWIELLLFLGPSGAVQSLTIGLRPDIYLNYGTREVVDASGNVIDEVALNYPRIRDTGIHELGHASHYELDFVGEDYWDDYRTHVIKNNGWGDYPVFVYPGSFPKKVALGEAVALYIEDRYVNGALAAENNWRRNNMGALTDGFVPAGLLFDLEDAGPGSMDVVDDPYDPTISVIDNIDGFTPEMFFDALDSPFVRSVESFGIELSNLHLSNTPNTPNDYNNLIDVYDVFD